MLVQCGPNPRRFAVSTTLRHICAPMHFLLADVFLALSHLVLLLVYQQSKPLGETRLTGPGDPPLTGEQMISLEKGCPYIAWLRTVQSLLRCVPCCFLLSTASLVLLLLLHLAFKTPAISL